MEQTALLEEASLARVIMPLVPFAAGTFIYIGASDLVPEVNKHRDFSAKVLHFASFVAGIALLFAIRIALEPQAPLISRLSAPAAVALP